jgi:hypothetical protein
VLTGVVFLILIVSVISANHLLASSKHYSDAVLRNMEIDVVYNTIDDIGNVLAFDADNTFTDAMSDLVNTTIEAHPNQKTSQICDIIKKGAGKNAIQGAVKDYITKTADAIKTLTGLELSGITYNLADKDWYVYKESTTYCIFNVTLNVTYTVNHAGFQRSVNLVSNKNMTLKEVTDGTDTGTSIKIVDETGRTEFYFSPY